MAIASKQTIQREVPHEPGNLFEFRRISWTQEEQARRRREKDQRDDAKAWGIDWVKALSDPEQEKQARKILKANRYQPQAFDTMTLLKAGIAGWEGEEYEDADGKPFEVDEDTLSELDALTTDWAVEQIIDLFRPPSLEEEKNDSGGSTEP